MSVAAYERGPLLPAPNAPGKRHARMKQLTTAELAFEPDADEAFRRERALVQRATNGDARACREIVDQHYAGMYLRALRMVGDRAEAEDLVQESFARAFNRLRQFDTRFRLSTWLYR